MNEISYPWAFISGLIYFFTPCVFPLIPSFLSFITGLSFNDLKSGGVGIKKRAIINSIAFLSGFSLIFISLGMGATVLGIYAFKLKLPLQKIGGILIITLGLFLLFQNRLKIFLQTRSYLPKLKPAGVIGSFIVGSAFSFSWIPCATPVLSAVLVSASVSRSLWKGFVILGLFCLGLSVPFILCALFLAMFLKLLSRAGKVLRWIEIFAGIFLVIFGIYIFRGRLM